MSREESERRLKEALAGEDTATVAKLLEAGCATSWALCAKSLGGPRGAAGALARHGSVPPNVVMVVCVNGVLGNPPTTAKTMVMLLATVLPLGCLYLLFLINIST